MLGTVVVRAPDCSQAPPSRCSVPQLKKTWSWSAPPGEQSHGMYRFYNVFLFNLYGFPTMLDSPSDG